MSTTYDMSVTQGSTNNFNLTLTDSTGAAVNLSGYNVRGKVKYSYGSSGVLYNLNPTITNSGSGLISIDISPTGAAALPVCKAYYDIERYTTNDAEVLQVLCGRFSVIPEITT